MENSVECVTASEFLRVSDFGDFVFVKVKRRFILFPFVSVFSALLDSSGLSVNERDDCLRK